MRLDKIGLRYEQERANAVDALSDVDLEIGDGRYVALLGPSGSGKSTLMHVLGCLATPTSGVYTLDGVDVTKLDKARLAGVRNVKIGFVFQRFHLMPRANAIENVAMPLRFAGVSARERRERARAALERVGLADRAHHRPGELSGGQQQRVAIARAIVNRPKILLADEPTGNLDSKAGSEVVALLEELHRDGSTVVTVTHDEELGARAERVVRLFDGRVVEDGSTRA